MPVTLQDVFVPIRNELDAVMQLISTAVPQDGYLYGMCTPLLEKPGKGIRPGLFLLSFRMIAPNCSLSDVIPLAAGLECIHWASLLHDDVIDEAKTRRGIPTVNATYDPTTAILVGDFFFSRALHFLTGCRSHVLENVAQLLLDLVSGQVTEQRERGQYCLTEAAYLYLIGEKTARFLATACALGTMLADAPEEIVANAESYGYSLGMVYQLRDDLLDITGDGRMLGKETGMDMAMGIETLPAIRARVLVPEKYHQAVAAISTAGSHASLQELLWECGALVYTEDLIRYYADQAQGSLEQLPPGEIRDQLALLLRYVRLRER
jgi:heptaprenyl diphosphate synthase